MLESLTSALIVYGLAFFVAALVITCRREWRRGYFCSLCARCIFSIFSFFLFTGGMLGDLCFAARLAMAGFALAALRGDVLRAAPDFPSKSHVNGPESSPRIIGCRL